MNTLNVFLSETLTNRRDDVPFKVIRGSAGKYSFVSIFFCVRFSDLAFRGCKIFLISIFRNSGVFVCYKSHQGTTNCKHLCLKISFQE